MPKHYADQLDLFTSPVRISWSRGDRRLKNAWGDPRNHYCGLYLVFRAGDERVEVELLGTRETSRDIDIVGVGTDGKPVWRCRMECRRAGCLGRDADGRVYDNPALATETWDEAIMRCVTKAYRDILEHPNWRFADTDPTF